MWEGEKVKLEAGASTSYQVILRERDYTMPDTRKSVAMANYAKAIVKWTVNRSNAEAKQHRILDALNGRCPRFHRLRLAAAGRRRFS